jgi:hypothetical protein
MAADIKKRIKWIRLLGRMAHERIVNKIFESKPERRKRLRRPGLR